MHLTSRSWGQSVAAVRPKSAVTASKSFIELVGLINIIRGRIIFDHKCMNDLWVYNLI